MPVNFYERVPAGHVCVVCGADAGGSLYWSPLAKEDWKIIRPVALPYFTAHMIQNVLFNPDFNDPYCGPACAHKGVPKDG